MMKYNLMSSIADRANFIEMAEREIREAVRIGAVTNLKEAIELLEHALIEGELEVDDEELAYEYFVIAFRKFQKELAAEKEEDCDGDVEERGSVRFHRGEVV